jgi:hypothetical protein
MSVIASSSIKAFNQGVQHGISLERAKIEEEAAASDENQDSSARIHENAKPGSFVNIAFDTGFIAGIKFALDAAQFVSHPNDNDHDMLSLQDLKEELEDRQKATRRASFQQTDNNDQKMKQPKEGN